MGSATLFLGWVLLIWPGGANFQVPMASKDACFRAALATGPSGLTPLAYCVNTETGEFVRPLPR